MSENKYSKWTVEGDKKTKWICGCFQTSDNYFKFCDFYTTSFNKNFSICRLEAMPHEQARNDFRFNGFIEP